MKKSLTRIGVALAATVALGAVASVLIAPAASAVVVRPVAESPGASSTPTAMEFRAMAGTVSPEASYYDAAIRVTGLGTVTAPAGTTIHSVNVNIAPENLYTISADRKTAVADSSVGYGSGATTVYMRFAFDKGLPANSHTAASGSFVVRFAGAKVLNVPIRAFVLAPSAIPAVTGNAVPGETTAELRLYDATTLVAGTMTITAPANTRIASVRDNSKGTFAVSPDGRSAVGSTKTWGGSNATAYVKLTADPLAKPGTTLRGGSAVVVDAGSGVTVAAGTIDVVVGWPTALIAPKPGSIVEPELVFTGVGRPGTTIEITDASGNVVAGGLVASDGGWSAPLRSPLPEGENPLNLVSAAGTQAIGSFVSVSTTTVDTPVVDPVIAGGAALALLAAVGTVVIVRRRRAASTRAPRGRRR